jgi:hypothetical protein
VCNENILYNIDQCFNIGSAIFRGGREKWLLILFLFFCVRGLRQVFFDFVVGNSPVRPLVMLAVPSLMTNAELVLFPRAKTQDALDDTEVGEVRWATIVATRM